MCYKYSQDQVFSPEASYLAHSPPWSSSQARQLLHDPQPSGPSGLISPTGPSHIPSQLFSLLALRYLQLFTQKSSLSRSLSELLYDIWATCLPPHSPPLHFLCFMFLQGPDPHLTTDTATCCFAIACPPNPPTKISAPLRRHFDSCVHGFIPNTQKSSWHRGGAQMNE